ncbi:MAG: hypothetical protein ACK55Z_31650, partial [bacterium]
LLPGDRAGTHLPRRHGHQARRAAARRTAQAVARREPRRRTRREGAGRIPRQARGAPLGEPQRRRDHPRALAVQ